MAKYISKLINGEELYYLKDSEARANLIDKSEKGAVSGVATLDENGKVPSSQLPASHSGVSKITVGETEYDPIDGNVTIPAYPTELPASDVSEWAKASTKPSYTKSEVGLGNVTNDAQVKRTEMGAASGVATLDSAGKIPSSQLPSYVDDVLEYNTKSDFPATGETGKIYIDKSTNLSWRWGGTDYAEISPSIALGETSSTAYAGDKGKALADKLSGIENGAQVHRAPTAAEVKSALGTGSGTSKYLREDGSWQTPPDTNTWPTKTSQLTNDSGFLTGITKAQVTNALGYTPPTTDTNTTYSAGTGLSLSGTTFSVKTGYTTSGKNYKVAADSSGNLYVNVPWTDNNTTYSGSSTVTLSGTTFSLTKANVTTALGYTPPTSDTNTHWTTRIYAGASGTAANSSATHPYIKITDDNTYRNQIRLIGSGATTVTSDGSGNITISSTDTNTDTNTWRTVQCNGTSIGNNTLNIKAGTNVSLSNSNGTITISSTDTNTWPSKVSLLTNDSGFLTAASFLNNSKGNSIDKIMVADSNNGLGYTGLSNLFSKYGLSVGSAQIGSTWCLAVRVLSGDYWTEIALPLSSSSSRPKCRNMYNTAWYDI